MSKMDAVVPTKLSLNAKFRFRCHKGIKCFTHCCRRIEILLTPYDIVRLKKRLDMTSSAFLDAYTEMRIDDKSSHPLAILKMSEDSEHRCPFVTDEGCTVYTDRPASCRYYPIGQGTFKKEGEKGPVEEEFYFFIKEPHCYGYHEKKAWTIESWRKDQEVDLYDQVNRDWKTLQLRKNLPGHPELSEDKQFQFYMASYDLDRFRNYILESNFLKVFDIDEDTVSRIRDNDIELIQFGVRYIKYVMMLEETLKLRKDAEKYRKKK
ncbi:MAG: YkgJ family cysteine cluster protein [Nitrospiraceae bacterium]|nr:MAG: YkgJ family cysteine cluster protein [Nitrospiraceae bacterium]